MEVNLKDKNYELYKRRKVDIFNMVYDVFERSPEPPVPFFMTEEEKKQYEKELDAYLEIEKPKVTSRLNEMGFEIKS